jgi:hypothetical protein
MNTHEENARKDNATKGGARRAIASQDVTRHITLTDHAMITLRPRPGQWLRVAGGSVHLTREGFPQDVFLIAGRRWPVQAPSTVLIEALGPTRIVVVRPATRVERVLARICAAMRWSAATTGRANRRVAAGRRFLL